MGILKEKRKDCDEKKKEMLFYLYKKKKNIKKNLVI